MKTRQRIFKFIDMQVLHFFCTEFQNIWYITRLSTTYHRTVIKSQIQFGFLWTNLYTKCRTNEQQVSQHAVKLKECFTQRSTYNCDGGWFDHFTRCNRREISDICQHIDDGDEGTRDPRRSRQIPSQHNTTLSHQGTRDPRRSWQIPSQHTTTKANCFLISVRPPPCHSFCTLDYAHCSVLSRVGHTMDLCHSDWLWILTPTRWMSHHHTLEP